MQKFTHIVFDHDGTLVDTTRSPRQLYTGIKPLIKELEQNGVELYIWTARERASTLEILKSLDIIHSFKLLCCGSEAPRKPSPQGLEEMLFGVSPERIAIIGDSPYDILGAVDFGATAIAALWAYNSPGASNKMKEFGANYCFNTVQECRDFLVKNIEVKNV